MPQVPGSLDEALGYLEKDHEFLLKGDVFTRDFLEMWVSHKRKKHDALRLRPHPYEFFLLLRCLGWIFFRRALRFTRCLF